MKRYSLFVTGAIGVLVLLSATGCTPEPALKNAPPVILRPIKDPTNPPRPRIPVMHPTDTVQQR